MSYAFTLFGPPGSMKSTLAVDVAMSIATGTDWHGHETKAGPVAYIAGERRKGVLKRIEAWSIYHGVTIDNATPIFVSSMGTAMLDELAAAEVTAEIERLGVKPVLAILDTLSRNFGSGDENSTADMARFVRHLDEFLIQPFGCRVMVVHHTGQADQTRARGNRALQAAVDFEWRLTRDLDHERVQLTFGKPPADFEQPADMWFEPRQVELPERDEYGDAVTSIVLVETDPPDTTVSDRLRLPGNASKALEALEELWGKAGGSPVLTETWREKCCEEIFADLKQPRNGFNTARKTLVERRHVTDDGVHAAIVIPEKDQL